MALLPVRRGGSLTRPGSLPGAGWDPFTEFEDLYQRMGQLMTSGFEGIWQPLAQAWAPLADLSETDDAYIAASRPGTWGGPGPAGDSGCRADESRPLLPGAARRY